MLRRYAEEKSQAAFAALVDRRIGLVYSVALRQCGGDAHLAEDVTQKVFADLARKAAQLSQRAVLSGWLCRSAQFAASDLVRAERRRRAREEETQTMHHASSNPGTDEDWGKLRPVLDQVMNELGEDDRDAVALRFFEGRGFADIGRALRLTDEAARKRVDRALDKLHALLARRGVTSTTVALGVALAQQAGVAAPAALSATVTGMALSSVAGGGAAAGSAAAGSAAGVFMSILKIAAVVGITVAAGFLGGVSYETKIAAREAEQREAEIKARVEGLSARLRNASKRAEAAEADTARLLSAIEQARESRAKAPPPAPVVVKAPPPEEVVNNNGPFMMTLAGDSGAKIAQRNGLTLEQLQSLNPDVNWARLRVGQAIRVK